MKVSDSTAWMTQRECMDLPEYSTSYPTKTTIGKRWKRQIYTRVDGKVVKGGWYLGEYVEHEDPMKVNIKWRKIVVMPKEHEDKVM